MNTRRFMRALGGVAALVVVVAFVVGIPAMLTTRVGWPLPTVPPSIDALQRAIRSGVSDNVLVKTLAVIAWIAWFQLAAALVVEVVAAVRGRQAMHLPVLPGFQLMAAHLVAGILMITATIQPASAHVAPPPLRSLAQTSASAAALPDDSLIPVADNGAAITATYVSRPIAGTPATEHSTVTVQRHDTYWAIAERTLGDGLRWREIHDLNTGRILADGAAITAGDETLRAGWVLLLPADATTEATETTSPAETTSTSAVDPGPSTIVVEPGDNLWAISRDRLEDDLGRAPADAEVAPYWTEVIDANRAGFVQPDNPNLILPGEVLVLPPSGFPPPADAATQAPAEPSEPPEIPRSDGGATTDGPVETPTTSTTSTPTTTRDARPRSDEAPGRAAHGGDATHDDGNSTAPLVVVGGLASIALAVGLKHLLNRRRRHFASAHDGQMSGPTPVDQRELHHAVVAQADEERIDDLQGLLGWLAASLARRSSARRPRMIRHADDSVEVLLDQADLNPPAGWTTTDDGTIWTLQEPPDPDDPSPRPLSPAPLLVTIGQPEDDAQLYLDLEADSLLALAGDPDVAKSLARSIATELTLSPLAEALRVIVVGDVVDPRSQGVLEHLTVVDSWDDVIDDVRAWASQSHESLVENDWPNAFVARGDEPDHDALIPVAIVADAPPPPELARVLRASLPSTVAVVIAGAFDDALATVRCEADTLTFDTIDLACTPQNVREDELVDMCRLLVAADSPGEQQIINELAAEHETDATWNASRTDANDEHTAIDEPPAPDSNELPTYDVLVRYLGDITVEGGKTLKPKATAVVAYLTLHRSVTTERLEEACWFGSDGTSHRKRLRDVMTECRDALGSQHLPANRSGTYVAGLSVRSDLEIFEWHVQRAADLEPSQALEHYRAALDLVTGKPFSYPNAARASYGWVDVEHHATHWEYRIARVAQACAETLLDADEPESAIDMLRRIVQAVPLSSALVESLMRAHIAMGDCSGAERVYQEHVTALEQAKLGEPDEAIEQLHVDLQSQPS